MNKRGLCKNVKLWLFSLVILLYTATVRAGMVVFIEQERYVQADILWGDPQAPGGGEDHALDSASDYGLFDSTVSLSWYGPWADASQLSEILGATVTGGTSGRSGRRMGERGKAKREYQLGKKYEHG